MIYENNDNFFSEPVHLKPVRKQDLKNITKNILKPVRKQTFSATYEVLKCTG